MYTIAPWAEANQGLLSLLALVAALAIALLENHRANVAEKRAADSARAAERKAASAAKEALDKRIAGHVEIVVNVLYRLQEDLRTEVEHLKPFERSPIPLNYRSASLHQIAGKVELIRLLIPHTPGDATLMMSAHRAIDAVAPISARGQSTAGSRNLMDELQRAHAAIETEVGFMQDRATQLMVGSGASQA